jgi:hypothetical protein
MTRRATMRTMTTMMMSLLPRVAKPRKVVLTLTKMRTISLKVAARKAARRVALQLVVTSRSANSNEIKQFKMMLKIYHNDK